MAIIQGNALANVLNGTVFDDRILGYGGNDTINGNNGNDFIDGGSGDDKLFGGVGNDSLYGGEGNDVLFGGSGISGSITDGNNYLSGGSGNDTLYGGGAKDTLYGGDDNDYLSGGNDNDNLFGDNGNDRLFGDAGSDILLGGMGNDTLTGGSGIDWFSFSSTTEGVDTVADFTYGDDKLVLKASAFGLDTTGLTIVNRADATKALGTSVFYQLNTANSQLQVLTALPAPSGTSPKIVVLSPAASGGITTVASELWGLDSGGTSYQQLAVFSNGVVPGLSGATDFLIY